MPSNIFLPDVTCPDGCEFIQNACYCACTISGMVPLLTDPTRCISTLNCSSYDPREPPLVPAYLLDDPELQSFCYKAGQLKPENESCPIGFTEWQNGLCFLDCPAPLTENALSCIKPSVKRPSVPAKCSFLFYFNGDSCVPNNILLLILLACFIFAIVFLLHIMNSASMNSMNSGNKRSYKFQSSNLRVSF